MTARQADVRVSARTAISDAAAMTWRHLIYWVRMPQGIAASLGQPILFVLLFRYVFGSSITVPGLRYVDYLMPGIILQAAVFGSAGTAIGLAEDSRQGLIDRFRSLPMARSAHLVGRIAADTIRNVLVVLLTVGIAYAVGFLFSAGAGRAVDMVVLAVLAGTAFSVLTAWIGLALRDVETVQSVVLMLLLTLTFASSLFVPTARMPAPLRVFAAHQAVSVIADVMRHLALGPAAGSMGSAVVVALLWLAGVLAVFAPLAVHAYTRGR